MTKLSLLDLPPEAFEQFYGEKGLSPISYCLWPDLDDGCCAVGAVLYDPDTDRQLWHVIGDHDKNVRHFMRGFDLVDGRALPPQTELERQFFQHGKRVRQYLESLADPQDDLAAV